ncbi:MAG: putative baseplate assembly protein [Sideroxyarcus sp.]
MPLPLPVLDRLTYDELVSEARSSLPSLAPGWTDYNAHDPGITLIELFAWLSEGASYRLDNIPDESCRAFLRLAGVEQRQAQVAETMLAFKPVAAALSLPNGVCVQSQDGEVKFQAIAELFVSAARLQAVLSCAGSAFEDLTVRNAPAATGYLPLGKYPKPGDALYLGFDEILAPENTVVSLGVWTGNAPEDRAARAQLNAEQQAVEDEATRLCPDGLPPKQPDWCQHYSVRTVWEYYAGTSHPDQPEHPDHKGHKDHKDHNRQWLPLQDVVDDTRALTLSGVVRFKAPASHVKGGGTLPIPSEKFFIRCRLKCGAYDCPPRIAYVAMNAVTARHVVDVLSQTFISNGRAAQRFDLAQKPVVPGSAKGSFNPHTPLSATSPPPCRGRDREGVEPRLCHCSTPDPLQEGRDGSDFSEQFGPKLSITLDGNADEEWQAVPTWDGISPHDRACVLAAEAGILMFGDGRIGRVPPAGAEIQVRYQMGGGASGNVGAGTLLLAHAQSGVTVGQPFAACGGAAAETLNEAKARAVCELAKPTRAVTLDDFEALAFATPGVKVARTHAIADYHPDMPCIPVSGSTTVVVLPFCPEQRPEPTAAMCATVQRYLERRRVLTNEIHVVKPHYTTVGVGACLYARPEVDPKALVRRALSALQQFFHPLHGGPEGQGWPIGRAVYRTELLALLNDLDGVMYVEDMTLSVDGKAASRCGNVTLCRHGLIASGIHKITINEGSGCHE